MTEVAHNLKAEHSSQHALCRLEACDFRPFREARALRLCREATEEGMHCVASASCPSVSKVRNTAAGQSKCRRCVTFLPHREKQCQREREKYPVPVAPRHDHCVSHCPQELVCTRARGQFGPGCEQARPGRRRERERADPTH